MTGPLLASGERSAGGSERTGSSVMHRPGAWRERAGAWLWIGCLQFFVAEAVSTLGWVGHYSYRDYHISDLGAVTCQQMCSHWHALMNSSFLLQGILIAGGALLLPRRVAGGWLGGLARAALVLAALGVATVAMAPEDVDMNLHISGARVHFVAGPVGMLLWGLELVAGRRRTGQSPAPALIAFGIAAFGDVLTVFQNAQTAAMVGGGTIERITAYPLPLWLAWTGWSLLRAGGVSRRLGSGR